MLIRQRLFVSGRQLNLERSLHYPSRVYNRKSEQNSRHCVELTSLGPKPQKAGDSCSGVSFCPRFVHTLFPFHDGKKNPRLSSTSEPTRMNLDKILSRRPFQIGAAFAETTKGKGGNRHLGNRVS